MSKEKKITTAQAPVAPEKKQENVLKISDFTLAFGDNVLFQNFELELKPGIYIFSGPSGVGKSTLMRVIAGLERRFTGKIELNGKELHGFTPEVHMMHQHYTSFPWLNLLDNTLMVYKGHKVKPTSADIAEAMQVLGRLGLEEHVKKRPSQISGGQDQRLSLASAFINRWSPVILYDEPTSALDNINDDLVVQMIRERQAKYGTIEVVITHEAHVVEGLEGTILEFSPEFRLRPPKEKPQEAAAPTDDGAASVLFEVTEVADLYEAAEGTEEGKIGPAVPEGSTPVVQQPVETITENGVPNEAKTAGDTK